MEVSLFVYVLNSEHDFVDDFGNNLFWNLSVYFFELRIILIEIVIAEFEDEVKKLVFNENLF